MRRGLVRGGEPDPRATGGHRWTRTSFWPCATSTPPPKPSSTPTGFWPPWRPVPRYEFFPLAKVATGWDVVERFYRHQYPEFVTRVTGYELLGEWANEHAAVQEYEIEVGGAGHRPSGFRVLSMTPVDEGTGLLAGERLYCGEGFVRTLLGPFFGLLEPIAAA